MRREEGYQIASGSSPDPETGIDLSPDEYVLVSAEPDASAARRWHIANRIRRGTGGSKQKILAFLKENVGRVVTTEELAYVAKDKRQYARRTQELRNEDGYAVATRFTGRPELAAGQYILQSIERIAEPHDRHIPETVQKAVYERDRNACKVCGWTTERWSQEDPRILELHHLKHHQHGGENVPRNLIVICSKCHDEVHSGQHVDILNRIDAALCRTYSQ